MKVVAGCLIAVVGIAAEPDLALEGKRWWSHVEVLANDDLQGRNVGSEGFRKAALYVAGEFERAGLKPAGTRGYSQNINFDVRQIVEAESSVDLVRKEGVEKFVLGQDGILGVRNSPPEHVEAPLIFAGHGLVIPEANHDDLRGLDVKGKIVVFLSGGPAAIPGPLKSHYSSARERWKALKAAGAIGTVSIPNPKSMDVPWERASPARLQASMTASDPAAREMDGSLASITVNPARAEKLFAGSGHTFAEILELANNNQPLPHFALPCSARIRATFKRWVVQSQNVVGLYPGSDPKLSNEYIVFSAHLDHLGVGAPVNGDSIYNGAMDDASGIASLVEIARMLHDGAVKTRRSILFVAVTGEEKGMQGSTYFANHPTVKPGTIVADINMDMFLPLFPLKTLEVQGLAESTLGADVRAACQQAGVEVQADKEPDRNRFIRSDQYSFITHGIPALAFKFGYEKGTPEERLNKDWYKNRYHAPSDDVSQPVDKAAAAKFNRILVALATKVANADERPHWYETSFFKRFVADAGGLTLRSIP